MGSYISIMTKEKRRSPTQTMWDSLLREQGRQGMDGMAVYCRKVAGHADLEGELRGVLDRGDRLIEDNNVVANCQGENYMVFGGSFMGKEQSFMCRIMGFVEREGRVSDALIFDRDSGFWKVSLRDTRKWQLHY